MKKYFSIGLVLIFLILIFFSMQTVDQNVEQKIPPIWELYYKGELNQALGLAISLLSLSPEHPEINLIIGRIYVDLKQYSYALPYLEKAVKNDINFTRIKSWALSYQGIAFYMTNQIPEAKRVLQYCIDLNIDKDSVNLARKNLGIFGLSIYFEEWRTLSTNIFTIQKQPEVETDIEDYLESAETALPIITSYIPYENKKRLHFFIWQTWEAGPIIIKENIPYENYKYQIVHIHFKDNVVRSLAKIIAYNRWFPQDPVVANLILDGFGFFIEKANIDRLPEAKDQIAKLKITSISIKNLWQNWDTLPIEVKAPLSGSFVKFLIEKGGKEKFNLLLKDQRYENAKQIYGSKQLDEIISEFEKKL
jgi:tetratricopeptide (TPR) repeat protein